MLTEKLKDIKVDIKGSLQCRLKKPVQNWLSTLKSRPKSILQNFFFFIFFFFGVKLGHFTIHIFFLYVTKMQAYQQKTEKFFVSEEKKFGRIDSRNTSPAKIVFEINIWLKKKPYWLSFNIGLAKNNIFLSIYKTTKAKEIKKWLKKVFGLYFSLEF